MNKLYIILTLLISLTAWAENSDESDNSDDNTETQVSSQAEYNRCEMATKVKIDGAKVRDLSLASDNESVKYKLSRNGAEQTSSCNSLAGRNCGSFVVCELADDVNIVVIHGVTAGCVVYEKSANAYTSQASTGNSYVDICTRVSNAVYQHEGNCTSRDRNGRPNCDW